MAIKKPAQPEQAAAVAAKGAGKLADRIIALAREHGIPIREDPDLVAMLARLDLEQALPPELYPLIAELLGFAYNLNQAAAAAPPPDAAPAAEPTAEGPICVRIETGEAEVDKLPEPKSLTYRKDSA